MNRSDQHPPSRLKDGPSSTSPGSSGHPPAPGDLESLCSLILDTLSEAILLTGPDGRILYAGKAVETVFGVPRESVLELESIHALLGPDGFSSVDLLVHGELTGLRYVTRLPEDDPREVLVSVKTVAIEGASRLYSCCAAAQKHCHVQARSLDMEQMENIFNNLLAGIVVCDRHGRFILTNPACKAMFGYSSEEIIGRSLADFIFDDDRERYLAKFGELLKSSTAPYRVERRFRTKEGAVLWLDISVSAVTNEKGEVLNLVGVFVDVTERHATDEHFTKINAFNEAIIDKVTEGLCVCHPISAPPYVTFTVWNERMTEITGYTMEEINSRGWYQTMYPDPQQQEKAAARMTQMRTGQDLIREEWKVTCKNGEEKVLAISTSALQSERSGTHVLALMQDITLQKQQEERLRAIIDLMPVLVHAHDEQGDFVFWNKESERVLGYTTQEVLTEQDIRSKLYPDETYLNEVVATYHDGTDFEGWQSTMRAKDGSERTISWTSRSSQAEIPGWHHWETGIDITQRVAAENELRATRDRLDTMLKTVPTPFFSKDHEGRYTLVNEAFCVFFHIQPEEILGKTAHQVWPTLDAMTYHQKDLQLMAEDGVQTYPHSLKNGQGQRREIIFNKACLHDVQGNVTGILGTFTDITEQKEIEKKLRDSEQHYKSLFENTGTAMIVFDEHKTIIRCNAEFEDLSGYTRRDIEGRMKWSDFVHLEDLERMSTFHNQRTTPGHSPPREYDFTFLPSTKEAKTVHVVVGLIPGTTLRLASLLDITARNAMEKQLRRELDVNAALARLYAPLVAQNATIENISDTVLDMARRITNSPQGFVICFDTESTGITTMAATDQDFSAFETTDQAGWITELSLPDRALFHSREEKLKAVKRPCYTNTLDPEKTDKVPFLSRISRNLLYVPVLVGQELAGQIVLYDKPGTYSEQDLDAVRRMSEFYALSLQRLRFREALMESEEKMRLIIESSPIGIRIAQDDRYVYANPAFVRMLGYERPDELVGNEVDKVYAPEYRALIHDLHKERLSAGKGFATTPAVSTEVVVLRKNERPLDVALWLTPITYQGNPAVLGFMSDISEAKSLRQQLLQAQKLEAIGTLAGGVAHDFNNILAGIIGYAELAHLHAHNVERVKNNLSQVLRAATRASDLVKQILSFSRHQEHERQHIQAAPIIKESLKLLRASLPATITIDQDIARETGTVLADPTQVHQIVMNLCTNAAYAMQEDGGTLEIRLDEIELDEGSRAIKTDLAPGPYLRILVSDTGPGIHAGIVEKIFDPYFSTKPKGVGTGLGLAVVRGIVQSWMGSIQVRNRPGRGAEFEILLPRTPVAAKGPPSEYEDLPTGSGHILFVDDEPFLTGFAAEALEHLGYRVTTSSHPKDALEMFCRAPDDYDLLITDYTMPGMTGDRLAVEVLRIRPEFPVIMCTGFSDRISPERARSLGIAEYVMKPLVMKELGLIIRKTLENKGPK